MRRLQLAAAGDAHREAVGTPRLIRLATRRGQLPQPPARYVPDRLRHSGTTGLPVEHEHVLRVSELPEHHRDPFDRLLVAQAQVLRIPLVTADQQLAAYEVDLIDA
ncbi:MAG TPA: type II toxin-antitoxin system VapC family toxin [Frankiaceae bacterium]|nr:type II toxin-antitoxin system VapC family toxin [Frankiaceae bacterium]